MKLSIIITAYKEEKTIEKAVMSFINQKIRDKYEILIACPDLETKKVVNKLSKKYKNVKHIQDPGEGKPVAMNIAFNKSKGEILLLSDGDVYVGENSLNEMLKPFEDEKVGIVSGRPVSISPRNTKLGYWSHLLTDAGAHSTRLERNKKNQFLVCSGYLYAFRKKLVSKVPEDALSEDAVISHFVWKKGYLTRYADKANVYVKYPTYFNDWITQKRRSAGGYNQIGKYVKNPKRMRSFYTEAFYGWYKALGYPRSLREFIWTLELFIARLYLWYKIYVDLNIRNKGLKEVWLRVESTK